MNVPSHVTGQMPNQGATRLSGLPPQNGGGGSQMQVLAGTGGMDQDLFIARKLMREKIIQFFQRHKVASGWLHRLPDIVKRVEDCLFRNAANKEDYMNVETLDRRLFNIVKILNSQSLAQRAASSSPAPAPAPMSTMIPTPGMSHSSNTSMAVTSADSTIAVVGGPGMLIENAAGTRSMLQHSGGAGSIGRSGSFNTSNGLITDGYQQSSAGNSVGSMPPLDLPHSSSQMIPTPGLNNMQSMPLSVNSGVESIAVPQQQPQKQFIGNQNLGGQLGVGLRSNMQSRYGFPNGGLTYSGNNSQLVNGSTGSEAYLNTPTLNNSVKPAQQHFEQQHHPSLRPRDSYGINNQAGGGNMYSGGASSGSGLNSQSISSLNMQSRPKINMSSQAYQSNLQPVQQTAQKPTLLDHSQKMEFGSPHSVRENMMNNPKQVQKFQHQQFQSQTTQSYPQFVPHQFQQQQRHLVENDSYRQPFMSSSLGGQILPEQGMESINEPLISQAPEEFNIPDLPGQYHQNSMLDDNSMGTKLGGQLPAQILSPSHSQGSQLVSQNFHSNQHVHAQNDLTSLQTGSQPDVLLQGQWHSQTPQNSNILDQTSFQHHIHNDFHQRLNGQNESQQPQFSEGPVSGLVAANGISMPKSSLVSRDMENSLRSKHHLNQIRWLLFLRHAHRCPAPKGKCAEVHCLTVQQLLAHIEKCTTNDCKYPRCQKSKILMDHHQRCQRADCPVCIPVRDYVASKCKPRPPPESSVMHETNGSVHTTKALDSDKPVSKSSSSSIETSEDLQPPKRMKVEHPSSLGLKLESCSLPVHENHLHAFDAQMQVNTSVDEPVPAQPEVIICSVPSGPENHTNLGRDDINDSKSAPPPRSGDGQAKLEVMEIDQETIKQEAPCCDPVSGSKSGKPKIKGVSLIELFTPEQVRQHITGLRQWVGQSKAKAEKNQAMEHSMTENSCQLCAVEKLIFEPPPIYCTPCGARIKRNAMYYNFGSGDTRQCFCIPCYNEARGDTIEVEGLSHPMPKEKLEKRRNDEETEEWWVQCDKCEAWQHQICALFNSRRNEGGEAEYTCPNCYVQEVERGERIPLPESAVLGADDLPRTALSDHLEQRLFRRLKQEKLERARHLGKNPEEVAGAESLVVRVVLSVDKKLEVKQRFLEIFQEDNYPTEFPYKSKVVLLFQKIEGVEVCLFGMYVQEFGSESSFPNQRRVYLSYLDSVKYFRPEIKTVTGEALRTFVYHEILIGYLEYCKKRGFTSCYIWACPPLKGEDYILYCHPEIQKTPKSDKLREWYLAMLRKAVKENIVADLTNLYDHFFITTGECKAKVTAARLPYFDGDYWPGAAEDMINQLQQEEDGSKQHKKGKTKKPLTKRALKAAGQTDLSGNASKDALLMHKLGETIYPMKEDFIMVHLQHACTHCCNLMVSGIRWVCSQCKKFQLCEKCYDAEQKLDERDRHPIHGREKHFLDPVAITDVPTDTKDRDDILESEFFDTRQAFLSLCQGNHYQYDTLRRAKHSSMMVLYHLHNPTAPAFVITCNVCYHDIEAGQNWHCEVCPDFDVCNSCYKKEGGIDHPHKLTNHPSMADAQNTEARQQRVFELRRMLDLLVHASRCRHVLPNQPMGCQYPDCRKVKGLFAHGRNCRVRASKGCILCKRMWSLLHLHARACKESKCLVPRCKDLKEHLKRSQRQSDSRRRAAVMEMMRQRAAEVAGGSG